MKHHSLELLLEGQSNGDFEEDLRANGWAFVSLPASLVEQCASVASDLEVFFQQDVSDEQKKAAVAKYENVGFKQTISLLSGSKQADNGAVGVAGVNELMDTLDATAKRLAAVLSASSMFPSIDKCDLPLLDDEEHPFAMFDVAYYTNGKDRSAGPPINCASHFDPGLFALSVFNSAEGLQLRRSDGVFVDAPLDAGAGVVWAGNAAHVASDGRVAKAIHRVLYADDEKPRLTFWLEVCTQQQLEYVRSNPDPNYRAPNIFPDLDKNVALGGANQVAQSSPLINKGEVDEPSLTAYKSVPVSKSRRPGPPRSLSAQKNNDKLEIDFDAMMSVPMSKTIADDDAFLDAMVSVPGSKKKKAPNKKKRVNKMIPVSDAYSSVPVSKIDTSFDVNAMLSVPQSKTMALDIPSVEVDESDDVRTVTIAPTTNAFSSVPQSKSIVDITPH